MRRGRRSAYVACAPAATSSSAGWLVVTPMTCPTPADRAAAMPAVGVLDGPGVLGCDAQAAGGEQEPGRVGLAVDDVVGGDDLVDDGEQVADRDLHPVRSGRGHDGDGDPRGVSRADQVVGAGDRRRPSVVGHAIAHLRAEGGRVVAGPRPRLGGEDVVGAAAGEEREVGLGPAASGEERAVAGALDLLGVDQGAVEVEEQCGGTVLLVHQGCSDGAPGVNRAARVACIPTTSPTDHATSAAQPRKQRLAGRDGRAGRGSGDGALRAVHGDDGHQR